MAIINMTKKEKVRYLRSKNKCINCTRDLDRIGAYCNFCLDKYRIKNRDRRKKNGDNKTCIDCSKEIEQSSKFIRCKKCKDLNNVASIKNRFRKDISNLCISCGDTRDTKAKLCNKCKNSNISYSHDYRTKIRIEVLNYYGSKCTCCNDSTIEFLSLDHKSGGGREHRKSIKSPWIYRWVKQNNFPDYLQILCYNCNMGKGQSKECPHNQSITLNYNQNWYKKFRYNILLKYGDHCECCNESNLNFMSLDHKNNDGYLHRKEIKKLGYSNILYWIRDNNYPDLFRILCYNCNLSLGFNKYCPHQNTT